jgi:hypothetical protein
MIRFICGWSSGTLEEDQLQDPSEGIRQFGRNVIFAASLFCPIGGRVISMHCCWTSLLRLAFPAMSQVRESTLQDDTPEPEDTHGEACRQDHASHRLPGRMGAHPPAHPADEHHQRRQDEKERPEEQRVGRDSPGDAHQVEG